jgi:hypothetical protein
MQSTCSSANADLSLKVSKYCSCIGLVYLLTDTGMMNTELPYWVGF